MSGEERAAAVSLFSSVDAKDPFARLSEIQTEISPSSDEFVGLNIRPLVELTTRKGKKTRTYAHQDVR